MSEKGIDIRRSIEQLANTRYRAVADCADGWNIVAGAWWIRWTATTLSVEETYELALAAAFAAVSRSPHHVRNPRAEAF